MSPVRHKNLANSTPSINSGQPEHQSKAADSRLANRISNGMQSVTQKIEAGYKKKSVVDVRSGDTVKVHQKIIEGGKQRIQIFEGLVIKTARPGSLTSTFTVRRMASGVGVEKTYLIHSPNITKIEVVKRSKVRRNYLSYMRTLTGKNARLSGVDFDKDSVNAIQDEAAEAEEAKIKEEQEKIHESEEAKKAAREEKRQAKVAKALAARDDRSETDKLEEKISTKDLAQEQNKQK